MYVETCAQSIDECNNVKMGVLKYKKWYVIIKVIHY